MFQLLHIEQSDHRQSQANLLYFEKKTAKKREICHRPTIEIFKPNGECKWPNLAIKCAN